MGLRIALETPPNADRTWPTAPWRVDGKAASTPAFLRRRGSARRARSHDVSLAEDDAPAVDVVMAPSQLFSLTRCRPPLNNPCLTPRIDDSPATSSIYVAASVA